MLDRPGSSFAVYWIRVNYVAIMLMERLKIKKKSKWENGVDVTNLKLLENQSN